PGTTVAAALAGFDVDELGLSTAWLNAIPVVIVTIVVIAIMRPRPTSALGIIGSAGLLWLGILGASLIIGMAPAGVIGSLAVLGRARAGGLGSLAVIVVVAAGFVSGTRRTGFTRRLGSAVLPYGVLPVGLLRARALHSALPSLVTEIIASPPFWLAAACLIAAVAVDDRRRVSASAARSWIPIGVGTSAFMLMGWLMTTTGMSEASGAMLPAGLVLLTPWLNAVGAVLTGSNTGANSMFTGTLTAVAASSHVAALPVVAAGNAAGSLAALAAPPRVAMAVQMADASAPASKTDIARVQGQALAVSGINALIMGLWIQFFV